MDLPTCKTCPYRWPQRQCRRFPPVAVVGLAKLWPSVDDDDWCGEHPEFPRAAPTMAPRATKAKA